MSRLEEKESRHENELKNLEKQRDELEALNQEYQETITKLKGNYQFIGKFYKNSVRLFLLYLLFFQMNLKMP